MKFSILSSELQKVLGNIGGVIPARSTLPILENFYFELSKDKLNITATDLDVSMTVTLKVNGFEDGKIAVPGKRLFETIRSLPETDVKFTADLGNNKIVMLTDTGEYRLTGESSENYPTIPVFKGHDELKIDSETLRRLINKTVFAVSMDELRPAMMGILFQIKQNEIRVVVTDGHRLAKLVNSSFSSGGLEKEVIIPAKALNLMVKSIDESETVIAFNATHTMFTFGATTLISRMIEEKYPNYESVIPLDNDKILVINKNQLLSSVRRTALYASSTTHQVRFSLKKNTMTVSAEDIDFGSEARENLTCDYSSEALEIGFNSSYIIDILTHIDTDEVSFVFSSPSRASIIRPIPQREGEDLLMLVMPVRVNS